MLAQVDDTLAKLKARAEIDSNPAFAAMHRHLLAGRTSMESAIEFMLGHVKSDPNAAFAGGVPYLKLSGIVLCGWQMARALIAAAACEAEDPSFYGAKIATAHFYATHILPQTAAFEAAIVSARGNEGVLALDDAQF